MSQEAIEKPREIAAKASAAAAPSPLHEGPVSKRDLLLKVISERCTARFKCRLMEAACQGPNCPPEAALAHSAAHARDPEAEAKAISLELLPLKFDISREAYGTGDTYVVIKSGGPAAFMAFHGLIIRDGEHQGMSTLALRVPQDLLPEMLAEMKSEPAFISSVLHAVAQDASALSFSIKTRIDVIYDRSYVVFHSAPPQGGPAV